MESLKERVIKCILSSGFCLDDYDQKKFIIDDIADDCPLYDLGIEDSLDELELVIQLEDVFNVAISDEELDTITLKTVEDVYKLIEDKLTV